MSQKVDRVCLRLVCEPVYVGDIRQREQLLSASITLDTVAEIKRLFLEFQSASRLLKKSVAPLD